MKPLGLSFLCALLDAPSECDESRSVCRFQYGLETCVSSEKTVGLCYPSFLGFLVFLLVITYCKFSSVFCYKHFFDKHHKSYLSEFCVLGKMVTWSFKKDDSLDNQLETETSPSHESLAKQANFSAECNECWKTSLESVLCCQRHKVWCQEMVLLGSERSCTPNFKHFCWPTGEKNKLKGCHKSLFSRTKLSY